MALYCGKNFNFQGFGMNYWRNCSIGFTLQYFTIQCVSRMDYYHEEGLNCIPFYQGPWGLLTNTDSEACAQEQGWLYKLWNPIGNIFWNLRITTKGHRILEICIPILNCLECEAAAAPKMSAAASCMLQEASGGSLGEPSDLPKGA